MQSSCSVGSDVRCGALGPAMQSNDIVRTGRAVASAEEIESGGVLVCAPLLEPRAQLLPERITEPGVVPGLAVAGVTARRAAAVRGAVLRNLEDVAAARAVRIGATVSHGASMRGAAAARAQLGPAQRRPG